MLTGLEDRVLEEYLDRREKGIRGCRELHEEEGEVQNLHSSQYSLELSSPGYQMNRSCSTPVKIKKYFQTLSLKVLKGRVHLGSQP